MRLLGFIADKLMNTFAPVVAQRTVAAFDGADWLTDVEADHEVWACRMAGCDYTDSAAAANDVGEKLDAFSDDSGAFVVRSRTCLDMSVEQLAAHYKRLTDPGSPPGVSVTPTAAVDTSATDSGGGGHPQMRDELIEELVEEYRTKLYKWFG
jgi:hypothetical protein